VSAPDVMTKPVKTRRGMIRDYCETKPSTIQRVPDGKFAPNVTFEYESLTFNSSCVNLFPDSQYVTICIDKAKRRLVIEPTIYHDRDGLKFANFRNGRNVPRVCKTNGFCQALFDLMEWDVNTKRRVPAIYKELGDRTVMMFNLDESWQV